MTDKPMIAIVGDDASVCRSRHRLVQAAGYAVETFASAQESLEWLPDGQAACLVLDLHTNDMSGSSFRSGSPSRSSSSRPTTMS